MDPTEALKHIRVLLSEARVSVDIDLVQGLLVEIDTIIAKALSTQSN